MKLIIGLGNPGNQYKKTRHNAGFMAVEYLADEFGFSEFKKSDKHKSEIAEGQINGEKVLLIKPQTFMNLSGQAVQSVMQFYKIAIENIVVIFDDVSLSSGTIRIRPSGSAGGHNGVKSLIQELGTDEFIRVRLGIEPIIPFKGELEDYVLGKLSDEESELMDSNIEKTPKIMETLFEEGAEEVMQGFN